MIATGEVRSLDRMGRLVIPASLRKKFKIGYKDYIEIYVQSDAIVLQKYQKACVFCGKTEEVEAYKTKDICKYCLEELRGI